MLSLVIILSNQRDVVGVEIPHFPNTSLERNVLHAVMCLNLASVARCWSRSAKGSCWKTCRLGLIVVPWDAAEHRIYTEQWIFSVFKRRQVHMICAYFRCNLRRQCYETRLRADKSPRHVPLMRCNKSSSEACDHVRDYFWSRTRLTRNKLGPSDVWS